MGRNSDKLYLTAKEHAEGPRGYKGPAGAAAATAAAAGAAGLPPNTQQAGRAVLPLTHCALTLQPWRDPVCAPDGAVFDVTAAMPYVRKHGRHPITGAPLTLSDLTPCNFHRDADGQLSCPVTNRVFTTSSRLVCVRPTGNVFAAEAVEELCAATRNWRDLLTDEPFAGRKDLIELRPAAARVAAGAGAGVAGARAGGAAGAGGSAGAASHGVRAGASDDVKRALAALGTAEASTALQRGGGGAAMEAARSAAEARVREEHRRRQEGKEEKEDDDDDEGDDGDKPSGGGDWRLRGEAPRARGEAAVFKPGAGTWDTSQYYGDAAALKRAERQREVDAIIGSGGAAALQPRLAAGEEAAAAALPEGANPTHRPDGTPRPNPRRWCERHGTTRYETGVETTGAAARAFTSTTAPATAKNALVRRRVAWKPAPGTKGYVRLSTTHGDLNLEIHCAEAPLAAENFLALCEMGYYDGVGFHRCVKSFMVQGGDPTETGNGGRESIFGDGEKGAGFADEVDVGRLRHEGRGVLAMANRGKATNGAQFYVTFKSAPHLDGKHTVFGKAVGGLETLTKIERLARVAEGAGGGGTGESGGGGGDNSERPLERVAITKTQVFVNPFMELARKWDEEQQQKGGGAASKRPASETAAAAAPAAALPPPPPVAKKPRAAPSAFDAW